jgi:glutathione S-transferase
VPVPEIVFYQIPISHFCEKVHWALDFKGLPYRPVSVNPFTRQELEAVSENKQVPLIRHGNQVVCESSAIVSYLDEICPSPLLVPEKEPERRECLEIERIADREIGPAVRRLVYEMVLADKAMFTRLMLPKKGATRLLNPVRSCFISYKLKRHFGISRQNTARDRVLLDGTIGELQTRLDGRTHFIGETLTIADIAVASLLNPLEIVKDFSEAASYSRIFAWMRDLRCEHGRRDGRRGWRK